MTAIHILRGACNLIVKIPCDLNKKHYFKADTSLRQKFRIEAADNVRNGLMVFKEEISDLNKR